MKVKQLEREVDRHKHGANQLMQRNEQLVKELENHRQQLHHSGMQMENMKRELGDALAVRAAQDEQLRLKDVEINELKSVRMDMDREVRDTRTVADRLENELHTAQSRLAMATEEKSKIEEKFSALEAAHLLSQDQANQLQDMRQTINELGLRERAAKEEAKLVHRQLGEERHRHQVESESLKHEVNEVKVREAHVMQDIQRKMKRSHAEYEATIQALKMELSEEKSALKIAKRNEEKFRQEVERLNQEMARIEEDNTKLARRLEKARDEFETQTQMAESDLSRVKKVEDELFAAQSECKRLIANFEGLVHDMVAEVDALMEIAATGSRDKMETVVSCKGAPNGPSSTISDLKSKMKWLRGEIRQKLKTEQRLKKELHEALTCNEEDRQFLLMELSKRDGLLEELSHVKTELAHREVENQQCVDKLQDQILDLTDELELRKIREDEIIRSQALDNKHIIEEIEELRDVREEKAKIEERYVRLQSTLKSLQDEITSANFAGEKLMELERNMNNLRKSPPKKKPVNGILKNGRSRSKSPGRSPRSRSPMC